MREFAAIKSLVPWPHIDPVRRIKLASKRVDTTTYSVQTSSCDYILTLFEDHIPLMECNSLKEISNNLGDLGFPIPRIASSGLVGNKKALLTFRSSGKVLNHLTPTEYQKIGLLLATLHQITTSIKYDMISLPFIVTLRELFTHVESSLPKELFSTEDILLTLEENWPSHLPTGLIHGDIWHKNIFFERGEISALLNFINPTLDPLILDLAGLVKGIYTSSNDKQSYQCLLQAYQMTISLSEEELERIPMMVEAKFLSTILRAVQKSILNPSAKDEYYAVALMNFIKLRQLSESDALRKLVLC